MGRVGLPLGVGRPAPAAATTLLGRTIVGTATATVTMTVIAATPGTARAALNGRTYLAFHVFWRPLTRRSERDRDPKDDRERDREDRDRRENGANGDDRKRMFSLVLRNRGHPSDTRGTAIDSPERPAHDDLDVAE